MAVLFFYIGLGFHRWLSPSSVVRSNYVDNEPSVDGSLRDKSQAQAGPHKRIAQMAVLFCFTGPGLSPLVISFVCVVYFRCLRTPLLHQSKGRVCTCLGRDVPVPVPSDNAVSGLLSGQARFSSVPLYGCQQDFP